LHYYLNQDAVADKFQNKYRIPSARWQAWDYSSEGLYFITINVENHECLFGTIADKEMYLSEFGQIVFDEWNKSFEIRLELFCDTYVIMPNHIHAILRIENPVETHGRASDDVQPDNRENDSRLETHGRASLRGGGRDGYGIAFREPKSISSFVGGFKSAVTTRINTLRHTKGKQVWQERFHDHVIRDYEECRRIGAYIDSNIENWKDDRYNIE
jgi:REP element-mobilizing transposase RayT